MKRPVSLIAAAHAAVALASFFAVQGISRTLDWMRQGGGGIDSWADGVADAARWPLIAAWIAVAVSLGALLMLRRAAPEESSAHTAALAAVAMGAGVTAVLVFRTLTTFVTDAMVPPSVAGRELFVRLGWASAVSALCFAAAIAVSVMVLRKGVAMRVAVLAVMMSLGVSAATIVTLRDLRARFEAVDAGKLDGIEGLINRSLRESPRS